MDDQMTWSLRGATAIAADDALLFMPHGNHQLLINKALNILTRSQDFTIPASVTVHDLPWPIKAIVEPNDGRVPVWSTHALHQIGDDDGPAKLSPFVYASRNLRPPMTKSLTLDIVGTMDTPVIRRAYPGDPLPPLPWQVDFATSVERYEMSAAFWRTHSFLFDRVIAHDVQVKAPYWFDHLPSPFTLLTY